MCACVLRNQKPRVRPSALGREPQTIEVGQGFHAPKEELNQVRGPRLMQHVHFQEVRGEGVFFPVRLHPVFAFNLGVVTLQPLDKSRWQLGGETHFAGQAVLVQLVGICAFVSLFDRGRQKVADMMLALIHCTT